MKLGDMPYDILVEGSNVPGDLAHLGRALTQVGFKIDSPLERLEINNEEIIRIDKGFSGHVRRAPGKNYFQLVVDRHADKLEEFARACLPVPQTTQPARSKPQQGFH